MIECFWSVFDCLKGLDCKWMVPRVSLLQVDGGSWLAGYYLTMMSYHMDAQLDEKQQPPECGPSGLTECRSIVPLLSLLRTCPWRSP